MKSLSQGNICCKSIYDIVRVWSEILDKSQGRNRLFYFSSFRSQLFPRVVFFSDKERPLKVKAETFVPVLLSPQLKVFSRFWKVSRPTILAKRARHFKYNEYAAKQSKSIAL